MSCFVFFLIFPISVQQPDDQRAQAAGCGEDRGRVDRLRPGDQTPAGQNPRQSEPHGEAAGHRCASLAETDTRSFPH